MKRVTSGGPTAILASPGSVDGYPPVQAQARLLAAAGFRVELVTTPFPYLKSDAVRFECPGVAVSVARPRDALGGAGRLASFVAALAKARLRAREHSSNVIEIAYDPTGILYSDITPMRPPRRIAHLHEHLVHFDELWREQRLVRALSRFAAVVVPDKARGDLLEARVGPQNNLIIVPNYPLKDESAARAAPPNTREFEVVYCGSVGYNQSIDFIGKSLGQWPTNSRFTVIGPTERPVAREIGNELMKGGLADRIRFEGWLDYAALPSRLTQANLSICLLRTDEAQLRSALGASNKRYLYMKAGLPQIGDMNPGVTELIEGREIGRCLRAFEAAELAAVVGSYVNNPELAETQGRRALDLHRREFNYNLAFAPLLREIEQLIESPPVQNPVTP